MVQDRVTDTMALIGSRTWSIKRCRFKWPWTTVDPDFSGTSLFDVEYLKNDTRYIDIRLLYRPL